MYIKRYMIASLVLMGLVGGYVYAYITKDAMGFEFFKIHLPELPIAIWVVVPMALLFLATIFHMVVYSLVNTLKLRRYNIDYARLLESIIQAYLGKKERNNIFKTKRYELLGSILDNSMIIPIKNIRIDATDDKAKKLKGVIEAIETIKRGEVADLRPYELRYNNELVIQNDRNRYKKGELGEEDILSYSSRYDDTFCKEVYVEYVKKAPLASIERYKAYLTRDALEIILMRVNAESFKLDISNEDILALFDNFDFVAKDYMDIALLLSGSAMIPEQRMKLFETLSDKNDSAMDAYLFTLFDLEMISVAENILQNSQKDEYQNFKAYLALKECNKNYNINMFV